jgi:excisionase family DNA binding protein
MRNDDEGDDWLSTGQVAQLLGVSRSTVLRRLADPAQRAHWFPVEGVDWRIKPLSIGVYQVRRRAAQRLVGGD